MLRQETIGLQSLSDFRKKRQRIESGVAPEADDRDTKRTKTAAHSSEATKLSFNFDDEDEENESDQEKLKEKEKEEKAKERNAAAVSGKVKHSKPEPARPPFGFFKEDHADWDAEKVKEEWGKLDEAGKAAYKNKANADKERYKKEMEEYNKVQDQLAQQKAAGGGDRQKRGKH
uniref:HMG box domain-containing protein n=1 Tax=Arcella intermedia TaxID=1963864 RepID=A0A6B2LIS2_9EUKA